MFHFSTAESAIRTAQIGLDVVSNNIANASTPGYHRQLVRQVDRFPVEIDGLSIGTGVEVARIDRIIDTVTEESITRNISDAGTLQPQIDTLKRLESMLAPSVGSLHDRLGTFLGELHALTNTPGDSAALRVAVDSAVALADELGSLSANVNGLARDLRQQIEDDVETVNRLSAQMADLNKQIASLEGRGSSPNDLHDRRDAVINELAEYADMRRLANGNGPLAIQLGDLGFVSTRSPKLELTSNDDGKLQVMRNGRAMRFASGRLASQLELTNSIVAGYQSDLERFGDGLVQAFNRVHAQGTGSAGSFEILSSGNPVTDTNVPLAEVLPVTVQAGEIYIRMTNTESGDATLHQIDMNPATESLTDLATKISNVPGLLAHVNDATGGMTLIAGSGFRFDFSSSGPRLLGPESVSGSSAITMVGDNGASTNRVFRVVADGDGVVGVTPGLTLSVMDESNQLVRQVDVGLGFDQSESIQIADGLSVSLSSGDLVGGDTFRLDSIASSDTSGLISALGINSLFLGGGATLHVDPRIVESPGLLATSSDGEAGDTENLLRMNEISDEELFGDDNQTLQEFVTDLATKVGSQLNRLEAESEAVTEIGESLEQDRISVSGVDPNEELIRMLQYQRSFQIASRYIVSVNEMLDDLLATVR